MNALKHFLKLLPAIIGVIFIATFFGTADYFLDIPSILIVLILPLLLLLVNFKVSDIVQYHQLAFSEKKNDIIEIKKALIMFRSLGNYFMLIGGLGFLIGIVQVLAHISTPAEIGPPLAIALLTFLYAIFLKAFYSKPMMVRLEIKLLHN
jgi:flagellar motor component MotA